MSWRIRQVTIALAALATALGLVGWSRPSKPTTATTGRIIFQDDFSNPKPGWDIRSNADVADGYQGRAYFIRIKKPITRGSQSRTSLQRRETGWSR